jgi:methionine synthase II (cobalamin-independent)
LKWPAVKLDNSQSNLATAVIAACHIIYKAPNNIKDYLNYIHAVIFKFAPDISNMSNIDVFELIKNGIQVDYYRD